uniref:uncharacterized protein LOC122588745 n=1 Tax=Erigeron canadensis TaxID=72917 RepID=UPI001CB96230|nr:uncharacterized protein LOC122588745 [Erigeron canadensis]XP_043616858.1 uncharacterized protein LOC122588745 [Erigeron canadensis]XP_043616859.1 uncharacterized protein LOC122588745 [Erigeron canadensis]
MKSSRLFYLLFVSVILAALPSNTAGNPPRWEVLEAVSNRTQLDNLGNLRQKDVYRFYLWEKYRSSSRSERVVVVKEIREYFTHLAYLDRSMEMIGILLFGPENGPSILHSGSSISQNDDWQCEGYSTLLFEKHCARLSEHATRHPRFFQNICNNVVVKTSIEDAFIAVCGRDDTPYGIDVRNRDINITPKPIHGSSQSTKNVEYCERVLVRSILRMELWSYVKAYRVFVVPSLPRFNDWYKSIRICLHQDASLGLCMCKKDDWRSMQKALWSSIISPYEQNFIDVKFVAEVSGFVTVTLDEVLLARRYPMLGVLIVGFCLMLYYAISFLKQRYNELIFPEASQQFYSTFHPTLPRKNFSRTEWEEFTERSTRDSVSQLLSSREFSDWVMMNASRIQVNNVLGDDNELEVD